MTFDFEVLLDTIARMFRIVRAIDMSYNAVQPALEVRAERVHANRRIALEFTVFIFFTASHSVFTEEVAEDTSRNVTHEVLAVHGDRVITLVVRTRQTCRCLSVLNWRD